MTTPAAGTSLHLEVARACGAEATLTLTWASTDPSGSPSAACDLSYYPSSDKSLETMDILFNSHTHSIYLFNLTLGQRYTAVVACDPVTKTNQVSFISGTFFCTKHTLGHTVCITGTHLHHCTLSASLGHTASLGHMDTGPVSMFRHTHIWSS